MLTVVIYGLIEDEIIELIKSKRTFEVKDLDGKFNSAIKFIEATIELNGLRCRVETTLSKKKQYAGAFAFGLIGGLPAVAAAAAAGAAHKLATYDPDYVIEKHYEDKRLTVTFKK